MEEDREIISGCMAGKRQYQKMLYDKYAPKMLYVCLRYTKNKDEAQDVLQEAFIKIFKSLHTFKHEGSFEGWLRRIFVNCSLEFLRNKKRSLLVNDIDDLYHEPVSDYDIVGNINAKDLTEMVMSLPDGYRLVFNLFVIEGYSHKEIGELLGISEGTSKSQLAKARLRLQVLVHKLLGVKMEGKQS